MATKPLPSPEVLRQLLDCDPETGILTWRWRDPKWFKSGKRTQEHIAAIWNNQNAGAVAFTHTNDAGYKCGRVFNILLRAHRVIWAMEMGEWPSEEVDHINGDRSDNRLCNLRAVSRAENSKNVSVHKDNSVGIIGVSWYPRLEKWCARICVDGERHHIGVYGCIGQAIRARKQAERAHGFHENHGRTAS